MTIYLKLIIVFIMDKSEDLIQASVEKYTKELI